ncbi:MAG: hypothetical protein IKV73_04795 [Clostridia bacterium]|nr:hypothetical protein [Clostridia bacterium]
MAKKLDDIKKMLGEKKMKLVLAAGVILGVGLIIISNTFPKVSDDTNQAENLIATEKSTSDTPLEQRLKALLSKVNGVGEVEVFVSYASTEEKLALKDKESNGSEQTILKSSSGNTEPYIYKSIYPQVEGVIIVAQGGGNDDVRSAISDAVAAVLELPIHRVKILKMK